MTNRYFIRSSDVKPYSPPNHSKTLNRRLIGPEENGSKRFELIIGELEVGGEAHKHTHKDIDQGFYILEGRCLIMVGSEEEELCPGMAVYIPAGIEHRLSVIESLKILVFYSPPLCGN